jgi:hypothetical protein
VSVGHIARAIEAAGIPTVSVYVEAFKPTAEWQATPRVAVTKFPMGRPLGAPGNATLQTQVIKAALELLPQVQSANERNLIVEMPFEWQTGPTLK